MAACQGGGPQNAAQTPLKPAALGRTEDAIEQRLSLSRPICRVSLSVCVCRCIGRRRSNGHFPPFAFLSPRANPSAAQRRRRPPRAVPFLAPLSIDAGSSDQTHRKGGLLLNNARIRRSRLTPPAMSLYLLGSSRRRVTGLISDGKSRWVGTIGVGAFLIKLIKH